ncbi:unnamed protein product [marine sediment metagenome]|jgi:hypothetical protein|uniref:Uncharacterized protein n=1 Tax=marine sediment metagenome TaxID=412755 RepID=X1IHK3_9ZZZZ
MSWNELKDDLGCAYSTVKWIILAVVLLGGGCCLVYSCIEEWKKSGIL